MLLRLRPLTKTGVYTQCRRSKFFGLRSALACAYTHKWSKYSEVEEKKRPAFLTSATWGRRRVQRHPLELALPCFKGTNSWSSSQRDEMMSSIPEFIVGESDSFDERKETFPRIQLKGLRTLLAVQRSNNSFESITSWLH
jgi:hypothetical protein